MKKYIPILKNTRMFYGIDAEEIESMLSCLNARLVRFKKGEYVLRQGENIKDIFVLVEGTLHIQKDDYWGNRSILGEISIGDMFGEAYVAPANCRVLNDVVALEDGAVILFDVKINTEKNCNLPEVLQGNLPVSLS